MYTRSFGLFVSSGVTVTTTTRTITETAHETGCPVPQYTTTAACGLGSGNSKRQAAAFSDMPPPVATAAPANAARRARTLVARNDYDWADDMADGCQEKKNAAIFFKNEASPNDILEVLLRLQLSGLDHHHFEHHSVGTIFIYVEAIPTSLKNKIAVMSGVSY
jgi:hypothetical protein